MGRTQSESRAARMQAGLLLLLLILAMAAPVFSQSAEKDVRGVRRPNRYVVISIPDRKLVVLEDGRVIRIFAVAVGTPATPSPAGQFRIVSRVDNPTYYHPGVVIPPGDNNPVGPRWIGLNQKGYGIHGTNEPGSIGKARSGGCIRMRNADVQKFYRMVSVGDMVEIHSARDERITQIFAGVADPSFEALAQAPAAEMNSAVSGQ